MRGTPRLDFDRLAQIDRAVSLPLVIHGGTGLSDEQFRLLIEHGVSKINYYTALADAAGQRIHANGRIEEARSYTALVSGVADAIHREAARCIDLWGSAGRSAELLACCRPWRPVEHVIVYDAEGLDAAAVAELMAEGRRVLGAIPGVRRVFTGHAVQRDAPYRHCWVVRFSERQVIESYRDHADHRRFADSRFRPFASSRLTIDYQASS
jgi:fructose-bisphosphate aldolase class II